MRKTLTAIFVLAVLLTAVIQSGATAVRQSAPSGASDPAGSSLQGRPNAGQKGLATPELIEAARASGRIDPDTELLYLAYALADYEKLPLEYRSNVPWHGTVPLLRLQKSLGEVRSAATRSAIQSMLSGTCDTASSPLPWTVDTTHFHVDYDTIAAGLNINDYTTSLETTWATEVTAFGWAAPPVLVSNPPPGNRYHVRIDNLGSGLYGYVSSSGTHAGLVGDNPNTAWNDVDAYASCMVLNRDYSGFPGSPQRALDATAAHEFNHSIQFGYGALTGTNAPDSALIEGGATWMEDEVFDSSNDNYNYLWPVFSQSMGHYTASPYPYWITLRGLTERYGTGIAGGGEDVMQDFWEGTSQSASSNMLPAINTALVNQGTTLADAYHAYAIAVKFNRSCGGGYVYPYCLEEGSGYVSAAGATTVHGSIASVGGAYVGSVVDNYALNWVSLPTGGGPYDVTLQNTSAGGQIRGSVACDTGSAVQVSALPTVVGPGGSSTLTGFDAAGCAAVVAVLTNQSQTAPNPSSSTARSYRLSTSPGGATSTPTATPTPASTPTPTPTLAPGECVFPDDADCDGCWDSVEPTLSPPADPSDPWDWYDVPVPTLFSGGHISGDPSGLDSRDHAITIVDDLLAVLEYSGTSDGGACNSGPDRISGNADDRCYDQDVNADTVDDGRAYDRSVAGARSGVPDGAVSIIADMLLALAQTGYTCQPPA